MSITTRPKSYCQARDLRAGDRFIFRNEIVTVLFVSHLPARIDQRFMEMMTRGRDKDGVVLVEARTDSNRHIRQEFTEDETVSTY